MTDEPTTLAAAARAVWSKCDRDDAVCHAHRQMWPCPFADLGQLLDREEEPATELHPDGDAEKVGDDSPDPGRSFAELRTSGLLWYINRVAFHPRGFALAVCLPTDDLNGEPSGWVLLGDGTETWQYASQIDEDRMFAAVEAFLEAHRPDVDMTTIVRQGITVQTGGAAELDAWREVGVLAASAGCIYIPNRAAGTCLDADPETPGTWCAPCRSAALLGPLP